MKFLNRRLAFAVLAALIVALPYLPHLADATYVHDDHAVIVQHPQAAWPPSLAVFSGRYFGNVKDFGYTAICRPLATLSFSLESGLGLGPIGRHAVQLALYLLLCGLAARLTFRWLVAAGQPQKSAQLAAVVATLWFAALPVHAEVVMGLAYRPEIIALLAIVVATGNLLDVRLGQASKGTALWATLAFGAALLAKESALGALGAWLAWAAVTPEGRQRLRQPLVGLTLVAGAWLAWRQWNIGTLLTAGVPAADNPLVAVDAPTRLLNALDVAGKGLRHLVWPFDGKGEVILSPDYTFDAWPVVHEVTLTVILGALALGTLVLVVIREASGLIRARWGPAPVPAPAPVPVPAPAPAPVPVPATVPAPAPAPAPGVGLDLREINVFAATAAIAAWLPVSHLLFPSTVLFADRLLFAPSWALAMLLAVGLAAALRRVETGSRLPQSLILTTLLLAALSATASYVVARDWTTEPRLFARGVAQAPRSLRMRHNLAFVRLRAGALAEAAVHQRAAAAIRADDLGVLTLGLELARDRTVPVLNAACADGESSAAVLVALKRPAVRPRLAAMQWGMACRRFASAWRAVQPLSPRRVDGTWPLQIYALATAAADEAGALAWGTAFVPDPATDPRWVSAAVHGDEAASRPLRALQRLADLQAARPALTGLDSAARALYHRHTSHADAAAMRALLAARWP